MSKKDKDTEVVVAEVAVDPRLALWRVYVENYKKSNPVKGASKEANGEFKAPPASFIGLKKELKLANGGVKVLIY